MTDRSVLLTGASGLVGRAVDNLFAASGWTVWRTARNHAENLPRTIAIDLAREQDIVRRMPVPASLIIHLAAIIPLGGQRADTVEAGVAIRQMDESVCLAAQHWQCPVLYASSCGLYRRDDPSIKRENAPIIDWSSPYFAAKLAGEQRILSLPKSAVFRLSSPVGPGMPATVVMARFVSLARAGADLTLLGGGGREQDFIDSRDVARLFLAAAEREASGVFNAASGRPITMRALAEAAVAHFGRGRVVFSGQRDPNETFFARYDVGRAQGELGWTPHEDLAAMITAIANESFAR